MTDIRIKTSIFIQGIQVRYGSHADVLDVLLHVKYRHIYELMCYINRYKYIADQSISIKISLIQLDKSYYLEVIIFFFLHLEFSIVWIQILTNLNFQDKLCQ